MERVAEPLRSRMWSCSTLEDALSVVEQTMSMPSDPAVLRQYVKDCVDNGGLICSRCFRKCLSVFVVGYKNATLPFQELSAKVEEAKTAVAEAETLPSPYLNTCGDVKHEDSPSQEHMDPCVA